MDLYPEIAINSGLVKRKWLSSLASWIDKGNCERAERVVVLSEDMADTIRDRNVRNQEVIVLNNFIIDEVDPGFELPPRLQPQEGKFRVLFAGNLGRFQGLETIIEAAERLEHLENIEFLFVGAGVMLEPLKERAQRLLNQSIFFHPYMPINEVMSLIETAHLGVVSLRPGIIEAAYPSKTMSYLEAGCKLLALVEEDSELADFVEHDSLGVVVGDPDPERVAVAIETEFESWRNGNYDRARIQQIGRENFSQDVILERWIDLLGRIPM